MKTIYFYGFNVVEGKVQMVQSEHYIDCQLNKEGGYWYSDGSVASFYMEHIDNIIYVGATTYSFELYSFEPLVKEYIQILLGIQIDRVFNHEISRIKNEYERKLAAIQQRKEKFIHEIANN